MRAVFNVLFIGVIGFLSSCSSDSDSSKFTAEERELRTMLNNEWEASSFTDLMFELPLLQENINWILDYEGRIPMRGKDRSIVIGMNKKGGFYLIDENTRKGYVGEPLHDLLYCCTFQQGNKFTGMFSGMSQKEIFQEFYVRKIDENTMILFLVKVKDEDGRLPYGYGIVYMLKKKGIWEEKTTFRKIFQRYRYYDNMLDKMIMAEENYERDVTQGGCQ
ncbi:hypothetical protein [Myroides sp. WP-1]|uniref:hypothetical protein n=1 Tax=Myroides sp. WP-1 TaxID=2759944 RepID=UPI0015F7DFDC|nr:hypothetical protein [Myroides sp. WP-1]MBB1138777.1 hypothetical protein [Myroides sp. WP-1]